MALGLPPESRSSKPQVAVTQGHSCLWALATVLDRPLMLPQRECAVGEVGPGGRWGLWGGGAWPCL